MANTHKFTNKEVIEILKEVLAAMEVKDFNKFRVRAYQNVVSVIEGLTNSVYNLWENNKLDEIPGIGVTLKTHLDELFRTGAVVEFGAIKQDLPQGMFELIGLRGIGAKKAFKLAQAFNLNDRATAIAEVKKAAEAGLIKTLDGFAEKSEKMILETVSDLKKTKNEKVRTLLYKAEQVGLRLLNYIESFPEVEKVELVGSFRRRSPTVGDIEFAIATNDAEATTNYFLKYEEISEVLVSGKTRSSVVIGDDLQVDIRVFEPTVFGSMLQYFTGSKSHNILLRTFALDKGLSLNEYGIKEVKTGKVHAFAEEKNFYEFLKLDYIPPELRQGKNEVELAAAHKLPAIINLQDIKGDLHTHTIASDGVNTLTEMIQAAKELGYEYIGITDHAPSVQSRGYDEVAKIIEKTRKAIDDLNTSQKDIKVLFGYEVNILVDATISLPDEFLKELDYAIGSVHTAFTQDRETMTRRFIAALENKYIKIIGHPNGRLINERDACDIDWREVFIATQDNNKILEINAQPNRLDLTEDLVYDAISKNIPLVINTDAHAIEHLQLMRFGIDVARRGWCEKRHILNTLSSEALQKVLLFT